MSTETPPPDRPLPKPSLPVQTGGRTAGLQEAGGQPPGTAQASDGNEVAVESIEIAYETLVISAP